MDICIVSGVDINKPAGDTIRTINFASELKKQGFDVTLIAQESPGMDIKEELNGITTHTLPTLNTVPIINHLKRTKSLIRKTKEIEKKTGIHYYRLKRACYVDILHLRDFQIM